MVNLSNLRGNLAGYYKATNNTTKTQKAQAATADATKALKEMDTNKDGVVSQAELAKELSKADNFKGTQYKATLAMAQLAAKTIDKDNNGISEDELMSYLVYEDSTQKQSGDKFKNSNVGNIDGKVDDFGKYVALRNLNYSREAGTTKTANANLTTIEDTMQSFIAQSGIKMTYSKHAKTPAEIASSNTPLTTAADRKAKLSAFASMGVKLDTTNLTTEALSKVTVSKDASGAVTITGLNGPVNKTRGDNSFFTNVVIADSVTSLNLLSCGNNVALSVNPKTKLEVTPGSTAIKNLVIAPRITSGMKPENTKTQVATTIPESGKWPNGETWSDDTTYYNTVGSTYSDRYCCYNYDPTSTSNKISLGVEDAKTIKKDYTNFVLF